MRIPSESPAGTVFERMPADPGDVERALAETQHAVYWLEDVHDHAAYPALGHEISADLVIVGGGYLGLWSAIKAKQRDPEKRVVLIESETIGWAASGRNGGFIEASLTHGEGNGENRWPDEMELLTRLGEENIDEIERQVKLLGLDCEFERTGSIDVALEPHEIEWLEPEKEGFLDREAVRALVNSPTYLAGRWHEKSTALVHPAKFAKELARAATELGVEIFENSHVDWLYADGKKGPITVTTWRSSVHATQVILATNVFPALLKRLRFMTVPVYDYALMTEPLSAQQLESIGWTGRQGMADMANQFHYYRMTADKRILFGGYDAVYHFGRYLDSEFENRDESYRMLAEHFFTTFPQLGGLRFTHRWAGAIDTSSQFCAFFDLAKQGRVASAAGFTGLGVGATHFAAEVLLDRLAGIENERTQLKMVRKKPLPFPPEPFAFAGIQATRWSLNQADHRGGRRNLLLRALDAVGLGFDS